MKDKRAIVTGNLFIMIGTILASAIMVGVLLFTYNQMSVALDQNVTVTTDGQTLSELNALTFGAFNTAFINNADYIGLGLVFGMVIFMFFNAFFLRGKFPTLFIVIDLFLLIGAYIFATYIGYTYQILINSSPYLDFFVNHLPKTSTFVLYLNTFIGIIGVITMIITYSMFPSDEQSPSVKEDLYGAY